MNVSRSMLSRLVARQARLYHGDAHHFKPPSMDELHVPKGSWQTQHSKNQTKYNMTLALGIGFSVFSLIVAKSSGQFFLNFSPPKTLD